MAMTIKTIKEKDLKISGVKTNSKDNDKGLSSKITHHEGTSPQQDKDPIYEMYHRLLILLHIVQIIIFIVDSGCTKQMTGNIKLLCNFVEKYLGTVRFENDQFAPILGYGDLVQGNTMIKMVYYVEGLNHNWVNSVMRIWRLLSGNLLSLLEIFRETTYFRNDTVNGLPKLKFVKDQLCSSCKVGKAKRSSFKSLTVTRSKKRLYLLHMDLCGPMRVESINDGENLDKMKEKGDPCITVGYSTQSNGYRVYNKRTRLIVESIHINFDEIKELSVTFEHNSSSLAPQRQMTPHDNTSGLAPQLQKTSDHKRAELRTHDHSNKPSSSKLVLNVSPPSDTKAPSLQELDFLLSPLFKEYFTRTYSQTLHIFGCTCYLTRDGENLDKMKEKADPCITVGYSTQSNGYRVYNKRTRLIVESIHINFDEIKECLLRLAPQLQKTSDHKRAKLRTRDHINEPSSSKMVLNVSPLSDTKAPSLQELDFLLSPLFKEYFTVGNQSVSKSFILSSNSKQQDTQPITNIQPTTKLITPTINVNTEENNTNQAADA
ncbi:retrovirus-related pol polyprotein from transposon TNT 1-94 [Tanacetum coccineum]